MDVVITKFGAQPDSDQDTVPAVLAALEQCRRHKGSRLVFPKGTYHFHRDQAPERLLYVSNNDGGVTRMGLPLLSLQDFELDGEGSRFIFHGRMVPVAVWDCSNIRLRRFSIDWDRPFTLEAQVLDQTPLHMDLQMNPATPYVIREGRLSGLDDDCYVQRKIAVTEFDLVRQEFGFDSACGWWVNDAELLEPGRVRLKIKAPPFKAGGTVVMRMEQRHSPALSIGRSAEVVVSDVAIHAAAGMGLIVQESRDLHVDNLRVVPAPGSGRLMSVQDDATHFCNCRGRILMENCRLENTWDDGANVHGIYRVVVMRGPNWVVTQSRHFQQLGVGGNLEGDRVQFVDPATMQPVHVGDCNDVKIYGLHETALAFTEPLPESIRIGTCLENLSAAPDLTVRRCVIRNTRPRGLLVNTPGKVLIEENTFHTPGSGVLIGAECTNFYESGAVRDVLIRRNTFDHCRFMKETCTPAPISIIPAVPEGGRGKPFEHNIRIEENTFRASDPLLVRATSTDGLSFRRNTIIATTDYPLFSGKPGPLDVEDCVNVDVVENEVRR